MTSRQMMAPLLRFHDRQESESLQQEVRLSSAADQTVDLARRRLLLHERIQARRSPTIRLRSSATRSAAHPAVSAVNRQLFRTVAGLPAAPGARCGAGPARVPRLQPRYRIPRRVRAGDLESERQLPHHRRRALAGREQGSEYPSVGERSRRPASSRCCLSPAAISANGLEHDASEVTWSVTPQWRVTDNTMLFATAAHGFKSGGFNTGFGRLPIAQREFERRGHHALRGRRAKFDLLDGRMRLAASVFNTIVRQLPGRGLRRRAVHGRQRRAGDARRRRAGRRRC